MNIYVIFGSLVFWFGFSLIISFGVNWFDDWSSFKAIDSEIATLLFNLGFKA